jgi:hypothetical protein
MKKLMGEIDDIVNGLTGLSDRGRLQKLGEDVLTNAKNALAVEGDKMKALRDSANNELEALARFWTDEADRREKFTERMAKRGAETVNTIDQLNKDLGPGFDSARRAEQARALKIRFDQETDKLNREEQERRDRLHPPKLPALDKIKEQYGSMEALDAKIAENTANVQKALGRLSDHIKAFFDDLDEQASARGRMAARHGRDDERGRSGGGRGGESGGSYQGIPWTIYGVNPASIMKTLDTVGSAINSWMKATYGGGGGEQKVVLDITNSDGSLGAIDPDKLEPVLDQWFTGVTKRARAALVAGGSAEITR